MVKLSKTAHKAVSKDSSLTEALMNLLSDTKELLKLLLITSD